ncbi:MAG: tetratricopeptide repeat protein [Paracoccaceae bacterium]|jgi:tetratricopeptide (TPR) repeat protein|nr:tetratricopeptide repeat protein [Paracoccaceae bacterium]
MKIKRVLMGIFVGLGVALTHTHAFANSQKLLDDLEKSPSVQAAKPIVDALWTEWTNAHRSENEQTLMENGMEAMGQGRLQDAENIFGDLIKESPEFVEAWNKRATVRFMLWKFEESRDDVFEVLIREPRHFGALSGLGLIYLRLGEIDNAMEAYKSLQSVFPASPEVEHYIPMLRKKLGLTDL